MTNERYRFRVIDDITEIEADVPAENILIEPKAKNTLPAIYYGIKTIIERDGDSTIAVLPSDHLVDGGENYKKAFNMAIKLSEEFLVTFGIKPSKPHTGYGYIKPGKKLEGGYRIETFVEKPDYEKAIKYVENGFLWNSGMFMFKSSIFIEECRIHQPGIVNAFEMDIKDAYDRLPDISVDYGIMEKTDRAAVVELDTFWSDVGSFDSLYEIFDKDENGNAVKGECIAIDSRNNLIYSGRLTAAIGLKDIIVVDTKDAVLVCSRKDAQKVKDIVNMLRARGDKRAEIHRTAHRPWGSYTVLEENQFYKIKRLTVKPKKRLSLQTHFHRSEHWVVVKGTAKITVDGEERLLRNGESTFIPAGVIHRLENPGLIPLEVIEVQIGEYLDEDDIERFDDDFGR